MSHETQIVAGQTDGSSEARALVVPVPRVAMTVRLATVNDIPFIDGLQKMHTHQVGWFPSKQIEGKIKLGHVLVAESDEATKRRSDEGEEIAEPLPSSPSVASSLRRSVASPIGYCIGQDHYMGRDDVGVIYHLNVLPLKQRSLIGATLIKSMFERAAYGCRLFCCWCAQDIQANFFWEACGFVPLAFRTGSRNKQRIHIFWQRRIREGDSTTPYWFPAQTKSGAIREDRLVLPIPPGTHWRDVLPMVLPKSEETRAEVKALPQNLSPTRPKGEKKRFVPKVAVASVPPPPPPKHLKKLPDGMAAIVTAGGVKYIQRGDYVPPRPPPVPEKPKRERKPAAKNDPKMIAAARELRDRWLEEVNSGRMLFDTKTKYEVGRALPESRPTPVTPIAPTTPLAPLAPLALPEAA